MGYVPALDGLRAIAVIAVVAFHSGLLPGGFLGVDVFFVLSGFLITSLLTGEIDRTGRLDLIGFYGRRVRRLAPALLAFLGVYLAVFPAFVPEVPMAEHWRQAAVAAAYLSDFIPLRWIGHTWSLSIEWQFYLIWPLVLILTLKRRPELWLAAAYVGLTIYRLTATNWHDAYYGPVSHSSGLVLGALLAFLPERRWAGWPGLLVLAAVLVFTPFKSLVFVGPGIMAAEIGTAMAILGRRQLGAALTPLRPLGLISYGVYLWHYPIAWALRDHLTPALTFAITAPSSILLATASYWTVERVFRRRLQDAVKADARPGHEVA